MMVLYLEKGLIYSCYFIERLNFQECLYEITRVISILTKVVRLSSILSMQTRENGQALISQLF